MEKELMPDAAFYELILKTKQHEEIRRDEMNKFFTSLFTSTIAIMPIIEKLLDIKKGGGEALEYLNFTLVLISIVGIIASLSWILILIRIFNYIESFDRLLMQLEEKYQQKFITYVSTYLYSARSPGRVTKQNMLLPGVFLVIFIASFLYNLHSLSPFNLFYTKIFNVLIPR